MGGCRCTFRSCTVNTLKFPGMHFFHYPLKQEKRLNDWIKFTQYAKVKSIPANQAKNKVVCALHFRDEYFMNYKKDRLVPHALPTLERLKNGMVLDYSLSDNPKPMTLPPTTEKHLIPPKGYRPFGLAEDYFMEEGTNVEMLEEDDAVTEAPPPAKRPKIKRQIKILNKSVRLESSLSNGNTIDDDTTSISLSVDRYDEEDYGKSDLSVEPVTTSATNQSAMMINLNDIEFIHTEKECSDTDNSINREVYEQTIEAFQTELLELRQENEKQKTEAEGKIEKLEMELANARKRLAVECSRSEAARTSGRILQKKVEELEAANQELAKAGAPPVPKPKSTISTTGQLTKAQLFNGIKKYLTASMTSLVRMEVFGGPERGWKADEKQVSVELLRLGEKVYDYFNDEWRFRLPPKKLVQEWMHEVADEDEEDL